MLIQGKLLSYSMNVIFITVFVSIVTVSTYNEIGKNWHHNDNDIEDMKFLSVVCFLYINYFNVQILT